MNKPTPTPRSDRWLRGYDDNPMTLDAHATMQELERELAEAMKQVNGAKHCLTAIQEAAEQRDSLADALQRIVKLGSVLPDDSMEVEIAREALASLKGGSDEI